MTSWRYLRLQKMPKTKPLLLVVLLSLAASSAFAGPAKHRVSIAASCPKPPKKKPEPPAPAPAAKPEPAPAPARTEPATPAKPDAEAEAGGALRRGERIEFDARLIQGQTAKAGAVYLFERASSNLKSMVRQRASFQDKILRIVYPPKEGEP